MKSKKLSLLLLSTLSSATMLLAILSSSGFKSQILYGNPNSYILLLDSTQKITSSNNPVPSEISKNVKTTSFNDIELTGYNVINNVDGWQTLLPNGYIFNPVSSYGDNNKISGIKSIQYAGNGSLELHYGYSLDNQQILYSFDETLEANTEYTFTDKHPSYFYLKNSSSSNVSIDNLTIKYSCEEEVYPLNNLKVLMIGNSFADDTVCYSQRIANSLGINLDIYDAYIGGCTVDQHYANIQSGEAIYSMRSINGSNWVYRDNMSLSDIVTSNTWDIITFQQASAEIGRDNTYTNLENLVNEVRNIASGNPHIYWHQTWAYDKHYSEYYDYFSYFNNNDVTMFNAIVDKYLNDVEPLNIFEKTIFNGTALQNLKTSYIKNMLYRDGKHLSLVHGRYLAASNLISSIYGIDLDLSTPSYIPEGMNYSYQSLVNESIRNARKNPYQITNSIYTMTDMDSYDLTNYTEIDAGLVGCSYYYSQDSSAPTNRISNVQNNSNKFVSTTRFTIDTLPIGSLVFIQEGLCCRPEAWVNNGVQSFRKPETSANVIEVDDEFWNGYQYRAFNIFKAGKQPLSDQYVDQQYSDVFDGFHIFVPNNKMGGLNPKTYNSYYSTDASKFSNNGLDIDDYERIHLDPITGFYKCDSYYYLLNSYVDDTAKKFVCTRPFTSEDLPAGTVIIVDSGYQYRSDCWTSKGTYSPRPNNVSTSFTVLDSSFMEGFRRRTFNVSSTNSYYVNQNYLAFMNHLRIYKPIV